MKNITGKGNNASGIAIPKNVIVAVCTTVQKQL